MMPTTHRLWNRLSFLLPLLLATLCSPPSTFANTITIVSGNGFIGSTDSVVQVFTDSGATYYAASIIPTDSHYDVIPDTQWIAFNSSGFGLEDTDMLFRVAFTLPPGYFRPRLSVSVFADNVAKGVLNGVAFGSQPFIEKERNFINPPTKLATSNPRLFHVGQNFLTISLHNFTDPSGLDFKATIAFIPDEPGCRYTLSPRRFKVKAAGRSAAVKVHTLFRDCDWTAVSNDPFITLTAATNGIANGIVDFNVDANTNTVSRMGTITIGGETLTITQSGAP